jgi:hypothetical protein
MSQLPNISSLAHTWLIDIDGTVLRHNGHLNLIDEPLPGVVEFWKQIPQKDYIVLLSARPIDYMGMTLALLESHGIRYDRALFGVPTGERILINDCKPSGLKTAIAVNLSRDEGLQGLQISTDPLL